MTRKKRAPQAAVPTADATRSPDVDAAPDAPAELPQALPFAVVGVGASAGGLNALSNLLRGLTQDTGFAYVLVQHLDPSHESMLSEILGRCCELPVVQAQDHQAVEPNHVYVIPPDKDMSLEDGRLQLSPRAGRRGQHRPIDLFFRSLAEHQGHRSIGVILSGSSSDGTLGLEEIKAAGGITFAQDGTAEHTIMPRSAIAAGCIDFVLAPDDIAREIGRISRHPYVAPSPEALAAVAKEGLIGRVLDMLREKTGVDFSNYKRSTLQRRITRRMLLHKFESLDDYVRFLQGTPAEVDALYQDILINVTTFFRDPEAYEALKEKVFPRLVQNKARDEPVRVWVLGCSTGEEAYSIAMAYSEFAEANDQRIPLQVFATDLNGAGIERARSGIYPRGISQDLSPERLRRFFIEIDGSYRVTKPIRDMVVFARQNVLADPPFSRMDLITCRNMLIYLEPVLQQKLLPLLHYSLQPRGFLWLGSSETIGTFRDLFGIEDSRNKIYAKKGGTQRSPARLAFRISVPSPPHPERHVQPIVGVVDPQREADRLLLQRYAPAAVVVNADFEIQQFRGETGPYLAPAPGRASLNLLKMLREGLLVGVRGALHRARREKIIVREGGLRVKNDAGYASVQVSVVPMRIGADVEYLLVTFEPERAGAVGSGAAPVASDESQHDEIARLRQELESTRDYMQSLVEQQEAANEELQSANEEVQSANEELQSINEELETSKEEIQSSNEELATVNDELQYRNGELAQSNNDLINLLSSVQMPIVMLGRDLRIRRFTPPAEKMLNLIPTDVGRPIGDITLNLSVTDLEHMLVEVIDSVTVREQLVQDRQQRWFSLRIHPYKTLENRIEGAVLVLVDVDQLRRAQTALQDSEDRLTRLSDSSELALRESESRFIQLADSAPVLIWVSGPDGHGYANRAYLTFLGVDESKMRGDGWMDYIHPDDRAEYVGLYRERAARHEPFESQCRVRRADGVYRWMKSLAVPRFAGGGFAGYVGCKIDITDLKDAEKALRDADRGKNNFLAMLAHELRTPLAAIRNAVQVIGHGQSNEALTTRAKSVIERQTVQMVRMVDDLLDLSRLTRGTFQLRKRRIDLVETLRQAIDVTAHEREMKAQNLVCDLPHGPIPLDADNARLQQVFANLLGNAARYTPPGGHAWLKVERETPPPPPPIRMARYRRRRRRATSASRCATTASASSRG